MSKSTHVMRIVCMLIQPKDAFTIQKYIRGSLTLPHLCWLKCLCAALKFATTFKKVISSLRMYHIWFGKQSAIKHSGGDASSHRNMFITGRYFKVLEGRFSLCCVLLYKFGLLILHFILCVVYRVVKR